MFDFVTICRALGDPSRVRILMALRGRQLCVCQITGLLDLAPSTTSKHLSILRQARLIESRRRGRWVYYVLAEQSRRPEIREALAWLVRSLSGDPEVLRDEQTIVELEHAHAAESEEENYGHSVEIHTLAQSFEVELTEGDA